MARLDDVVSTFTGKREKAHCTMRLANLILESTFSGDVQKTPSTLAKRV